MADRSEILIHPLFGNECLCRFCPGNALVEPGGDLRVDFTHATVQLDEPALEIPEGDCRERNDNQNQKSHFPVQREHEGDGADDISDIPYAVHQTP